MATEILMKNPQTALIKTGLFGFSWTYLFFGWIVPLVRGEIGIGVLHLICTVFTLGIWQIVFAFMYNKQYTTRLIEKGYVLSDNETKMVLARKALNIAAP